MFYHSSLWFMGGTSGNNTWQPLLHWFLLALYLQALVRQTMGTLVDFCFNLPAWRPPLSPPLSFQISHTHPSPQLDNGLLVGMAKQIKHVTPFQKFLAFYTFAGRKEKERGRQHFAIARTGDRQDRRTGFRQDMSWVWFWLT